MENGPRTAPDNRHRVIAFATPLRGVATDAALLSDLVAEVMRVIDTAPATTERYWIE